jgi:hypothetical protein
MVQNSRKYLQYKTLVLIMCVLIIVTRTCANYRNKIICVLLGHLRANYSN